MSARFRVPCLALVALLLGALAPAHAAAIPSVRSTIFAGTVTCTLDDSFTHTKTRGDPGNTTTTTIALVEHADTTYTLIAGQPILTVSHYSYNRTFHSTTTITGQGDVVDDTKDTEQGSHSGPVRQKDDFQGFELNVRAKLAMGTVRIPTTKTYEQSHRIPGHVLTSKLPARPGAVDYPDRNTPGPVLTVTEGGSLLSGSAGKTVIDRQTNQVDGHDGCTWNLVIVLFNGKPMSPMLPGGTPAATRVPTPTTSLPQKQCSVMPRPSKAAPPPPDEGFADRLHRQSAPVLVGARSSSAQILWRETPQLTWSDYRPESNPPTDILAMTWAGLGAAVRYTTTDAVCDPKSKLYTYTVAFTIGDEHAHFDPDQSWGSAALTSNPLSEKAKNVLNHEQRHFDITEVYSRFAHTKLLGLLGGSLTQTFTCAQPSGCVAAIMALDKKLESTLTAIVRKWTAKQQAYDNAAGRVDRTVQQAEWDAMIDGWLAKPGVEPTYSETTARSPCRGT